MRMKSRASKCGMRPRYAFSPGGAQRSVAEARARTGAKLNGIAITGT